MFGLNRNSTHLAAAVLERGSLEMWCRRTRVECCLCASRLDAVGFTCHRNTVAGSSFGVQFWKTGSQVPSVAPFPVVVVLSHVTGGIDLCLPALGGVKLVELKDGSYSMRLPSDTPDHTVLLAALPLKKQLRHSATLCKKLHACPTAMIQCLSSCSPRNVYGLTLSRRQRASSFLHQHHLFHHSTTTPNSRV